MKRLVCLLRGCVRIEDIPISLSGRFAVLAGLWMPPTTCSRCGKKYEGENVQYAEGSGYLKPNIPRREDGS